ncbi:MAG: AraC family transcriptional regulator [Burkholderiales bacterium RIFCSPLOWO2_12_67_14]|nr:MAG: AraC family transcriptional regulator [Burkholderiales bacterium RIFCSPLOWO2_02_FULL_67_64]OGB37434.1 MAG: AraC family transcriptional regulator [Burkholderiales bacterium RIFCSPHIGHO2_12_FULL_67_38]OGB38907.1 MAG: AraC family transcriptional regulator [Burkholderiales bacterium RIFCSPLOWO2_12_67_14]OGB80770.1 MAG: AraC family transcriptional regulator [Burkholderiales bacterium RIFCSPLOWO2_12_FULL_67_210]
MTAKTHAPPRQLRPELEHEYARSPDLGYESPTEVGFVRCLAHGFPTPLARWHYHDEYELHLITATSGKVFVGDWIGPFQPGQLVLTGPRLPHNWVSMDLPQGGVPLRDLVIQFSHEPLVRASDTIPELAEVLPLLERAKHGIEFFGLSEAAEAHWHKVKNTRGLRRFTAFCDFMCDLAACTDYRLLSAVQLQSTDDDASLDQIDAVVSRITEHLSEEHSAAALAAELGMSESRFSRFFRRATGNTFTDFVNRVRISRACQLLMDSEQQVTHICYEVGFNNVANFNRRFLEIKGMTPSEFRKQSLTRFRGAV